ncbi:UvrD-helicase domain-containing protein [Gracilibacillus marinus]|uniref:UvrD-helicase domain-containing protein n=1 Tax=Gracilibacillus marinus TaxID=630535 RepID=A0ABV8VUU0_9BACI
MPTWTKEQEDAIYQSGKNILVAAAAGSGKTAVLVERIIQKVLNKEDPVNIDQLLVVTFTNAAAQEMRNRIGEALEEALANDPKSNHLKKQLSLLQHASISTLHSFCMELVRKYAYHLDIDPKFRIADDVEADLIRQDVLEQLFELWYGEKEAEDMQSTFFGVVDRFSNDRNDLDLESLILKLHEFSIQHPNPDKYLEQLKNTYDVGDSVSEPEWLAILKKEVTRQLEVMTLRTEEALQLTKEADGPFHYADQLDADKEMLMQAKGALAISWDEARTIFTTSKFQQLSRKKVDCNEEKKETVKAIRDDVKKRWKKISEEWFQRSLSNHLEDMRTLYPVIAHVTEMIKQFHEQYQEEKKERGLVDFSDLEHFALDILLEDKESKLPSAIAKQLQEKYKEIMVDEYQDTNIVQETIVQSVANQIGQGNMFMVGDVKQSIVRP